MGKILHGLKLIAGGTFGIGSDGAIAKKWMDFQFWLNGRDWDIPIGPVFGKAGTTTTITVAPQCYFRGEKLMAQDTGWVEVPVVDEVAVARQKTKSKKKGTRPKTVASAAPQEPKKLVPGAASRICQILVGQKLQRSATGGGTLTIFFGNNSPGNGLKWDVSKPYDMIAMTVSFIQDCTFDATVFGRAII